MTLMHLWLVTLSLLVLVVLALQATRNSARNRLLSLDRKVREMGLWQAEAERRQMQMQMRLRDLQQQLEQEQARNQAQSVKMEQQLQALQSLNQRPVRLNHLASLAEQGHDMHPFVEQGQLNRAEAALISKLHANRRH